MPVDPGLIGPTTLSLTQSLSLFQGFLPKFTEIRREDPVNNPEFASDVRLGELAAAILTIGIGATMSALTGSPVPSVIAMLSAVGLIVLYESALRSKGATANA